jgi:very-short-patch-repair endonuclease
METSQRPPTPAEAELERIFNTLGGGALAGEFMREWPLGNWFIDFYFPAVKLAIEVDGGYHRAPLQWRRDLHKAAELDAEGITLLRVANAEVFGERQHLIEKLRAAWRVAHARTAQSVQATGSARSAAHELATEREQVTGTVQQSLDRFKLHEPAPPAYAVPPAVKIRDIELIFANGIALTRKPLQPYDEFVPSTASQIMGRYKLYTPIGAAIAQLG